METTRLSTKGQIILPKSIRSKNAWGPGLEFEIQEMSGGVLLKPVKRFPRTTLDQVAGCLKYKGKPKTIEEMDAGIAKAVKERYARGRY